MRISEKFVCATSSALSVAAAHAASHAAAHVLVLGQRLVSVQVDSVYLMVLVHFQLV